MASARKSSLAFSLSVSSLIAVAALSAHASPIDTAADVHEKGGYPDAILPLDVPLPAGVAIDSQMDSESKPKAAPKQQGEPSEASAPDRNGSGRDDEHAQRDTNEHDNSKRPPDSPRSSFVTIGGGSTFAQLLLIVALAVLAAFLVALISSRRAGTADPKAPLDTGKASEPARPEAPMDLANPDADVDALVSAGRLGEAILVLLLRALRRVGWEPAGSGQSATARDVLGTLGATDPRRQPLEALIALAEGVRFAGVSPTPDVLSAVRSRYQQLDEVFRRATG